MHTFSLGLTINGLQEEQLAYLVRTSTLSEPREQGCIAGFGKSNYVLATKDASMMRLG